MTTSENVDAMIENARARRVVRSTPSLARSLRLEAGLTLKEVSAALGVSHVAVWRWERGYRTPRAENARRLLEFLRRAAGAERPRR